MQRLLRDRIDQVVLRVGAEDIPGDDELPCAPVPSASISIGVVETIASTSGGAVRAEAAESLSGAGVSAAKAGASARINIRHRTRSHSRAVISRFIGGKVFGT